MSIANADLRTLAFGDAPGTIWGAAIAGETTIIVFGDRTGAGAAVPVTEADWGDGDGRWQMSGDGFSLTVESVSDDVAEPGEDDGDTVSGVQELCQVHGSITVAGTQRTIDCVGTRSAIAGVDAGSLGSARAVSAWFGPEEALTLVALRAHESAGQESDLVAATLFDPEGWMGVSDPRLSTTYTDAGVPARVNLELWVGDGEHEYPRRAAGEVSGPGATAELERLSLQVVPMVCHSRGREGAGVYVLAAF